MNAKIKGYPNLDVVLRHYDALQILIQHAKKSVDGAKALAEWDIARARPVKEIVFEVINEPCPTQRVPDAGDSGENN